MPRTIFILLLTLVNCSFALTWDSDHVNQVITWHQIDTTKFLLRAGDNTYIKTTNNPAREGFAYMINAEEYENILSKINTIKNTETNTDEKVLEMDELVSLIMAHIWAYSNGDKDSVCDLCINDFCIGFEEDYQYYKNIALAVDGKNEKSETEKNLDTGNWIYRDYGQMIIGVFLTIIIIVMAHVIISARRYSSVEIIARISKLETSLLNTLENGMIIQKISGLERSFSEILEVTQSRQKNTNSKTLLTMNLDLQSRKNNIIRKTIKVVPKKFNGVYDEPKLLSKNRPEILKPDSIPPKGSGQSTNAKSDFSGNINSCKISNWVDKTHKEQTRRFENFVESYRKGELLFKKEEISQLSSKEHRKIYSALYFLKEWQYGEQARNPPLAKELEYIQDLIKSRLATLRKQDICSGVFPTTDSYDPDLQQEEIKTRYKEYLQVLLEKLKKIEQEQFGSMQSIVFEEWSTIFIGKIAECLDSFLMDPVTYKQGSRLLSIFGYDFIPVSIGDEYKSRVQHIAGYEKSEYPEGRVTRIERHGLETTTGDLYKKACVILSKMEN